MIKRFTTTLYFSIFFYLVCYGQQNLITSHNLSLKVKVDPLSDYKASIFEKPLKKYVKAFPIDAAPTKDVVFIDFVGSGDIQKSISEGNDINANTGLGVIFERFSGVKNGNTFTVDKVIQSLELEGIINIATTADTIKSELDNNILQNRRDFGTYIINPISRRQSLFINSNVYFGYPTKKDEKDKLSVFGTFSKVISGMNFRVISSNNKWQYNDTITDLGVLAFRAGVFHEFIPDNYRLTEKGRSRYSLFLGANYAYRGIFGDISSLKNDNLRTNILGNTKKNFGGLEMNFGFRLNNLRAEFQMPMLKSKGDGHIEGLTDTQFLFSIRFVGGFSLKLKDSDDG